MKLTVEGTTYEFDHRKLMASEGREIKDFTGMTLAAWSKAVEELDPDAVQALVWLAKSRAGEQVDIASLDFDLFDVRIEREPDPTVAAADPTVDKVSGDLGGGAASANRTRPTT